MADFVNQTTDPVFTDTLRQGLLVEMSQSPFFNFLPASNVRETLAVHGAQRARSAERRPGSPGVPAQSGQGFHRWIHRESGELSIFINLKAVNCSTGDVMAQQQIQVANKEDVIRALSEPSLSAARQVGRVAGQHSEVRCSSGAGDYGLTRGAAGLHHRQTETGSDGHAVGDRALSASY